MAWSRVWLCLVILSVASSEEVSEEFCSLSPELAFEIYQYHGFIDQIVEAVTRGSYAGKLYNDLTKFTDKYGARKTGSEVLDLSMEELRVRLTKEGLTTRLEDVEAPLWQREKEDAYYITTSQKKKLRIKALGGSDSDNVTGVLMVVKDLEELVEKKDDVPGKIVLFSPQFKTYSSNAVLRIDGPDLASCYGAVGALVSSASPFSIGTIQGGMTNFDKFPPIPAASVSAEDADLLIRLSQSEEVKINLIIINKAGSGTISSQNLVFDIPGSSQPQNYVTMSGHIDSWDVGNGVLDDAGGAFLAMHALLLLKHLNIIEPQRTLRGIMWTGGETGFHGAKAYAEIHAYELNNWSIAFESYAGLFQPKGFIINGNGQAACILKHIALLFNDLNTTRVIRTDEKLPTDISIFQRYNIPLMAPLMEDNNYYSDQHTEGDSIRLTNSDLMDRHLAMIAGTSYILANLSIALPRGDAE